MRRRIIISQISSLLTLSCLLSLKMNPSLASFSAPTSSNKSKSIRDLVAPDPPPGLHPVYEEPYMYDSLQKTTLLIKTPTRLNYVAPETVRATVKRDPSGYDSETTGAIWQEQTVWVENGRRRRPRYKLDPNGFELVPNDPVSREIDFTSKDEVLDNYYPHCEQLLERYLMGSSTTAAQQHVTVKAFDHNVRKQLPADGETIMKPLGLVHGDYTATSAPRRIQLLAEPPRINDVRRETTPLLDPSIVAECLAGKRRFALINVWRNIDPDHPVQSFPLACMDAQTYTRDDLRVLELHYEDRIGENFLACPADATGDRPQHRWIYFPEMHYDEALLIKQWDSLGGLARDKESAGDDDDDDDDDTGIATMSIHSAFLDPCTTETAPPRQSIEVRCVAIWEPSK